MSIKQAGIGNSETVKAITVQTIKEIYPHYYPQGAVDFFLSHHNDENIGRDVRTGCVFLCMDARQNAIGTVTVRNNEICRLFVLPERQKQGFGRELLDFAENKIAEEYGEIVLDASLPAKMLYLKRGYAVVGAHSIQVGRGDFLCYDVMKKKL